VLAATVGKPFDRCVKVWNVKTGCVLLTLAGHANRTDEVFFEADGRRIWSEGIGRYWGRYLLRWNWHDREYERELRYGSFRAASPDGQYFVWGEGDVVHLSRTDAVGSLASYSTGAEAIQELVASLPWIAFTTKALQPEILKFEGLDCGPSVVTRVRRWLFGQGESAGKWEDAVTFLCPGCGSRQPVPKPTLRRVDHVHQTARLKKSDSPCFSLPNQVWQEPELSAPCSNCSAALLFNPFIAGGH
jgi:hypothetical protein